MKANAGICYYDHVRLMERLQSVPDLSGKQKILQQYRSAGVNELFLTESLRLVALLAVNEVAERVRVVPFGNEQYEGVSVGIGEQVLTAVGNLLYDNNGSPTSVDVGTLHGVLVKAQNELVYRASQSFLGNEQMRAVWEVLQTDILGLILGHPQANLEVAATCLNANYVFGAAADLDVLKNFVASYLERTSFEKIVSEILSRYSEDRDFSCWEVVHLLSSVGGEKGMPWASLLLEALLQKSQKGTSWEKRAAERMLLCYPLKGVNFPCKYAAVVATLELFIQDLKCEMRCNSRAEDLFFEWRKYLGRRADALVLSIFASKPGSLRILWDIGEDFFDPGAESLLYRVGGDRLVEALRSLCVADTVWSVIGSPDKELCYVNPRQPAYNDLLQVLKGSSAENGISAVLQPKVPHPVVEQVPYEELLAQIEQAIQLVPAPRDKREEQRLADFESELAGLKRGRQRRQKAEKLLWRVKNSIG